MNKIADRRVEELLNLLLTQSSPITINELSKILGVSNRTIRNDLDKLETYLAGFKEDMHIIKKPGVGIWLEYSKIGLSKLQNLKEINGIYIEPFSSEERQKLIIKKLVQATEAISMQTIADELFVSRVTVYKDLKYVEKWLQRYDLRLSKKQNHGIEIRGDEKGWRRAASDLLLDLKKEQEIKEIISHPFEFPSNSRLNEHDLNHLKELIPHIEIAKIENILVEAEKKLKYLLSNEAFTGLFIHIAISIERLKQKKDIKMNQKYLKDIQSHGEYTIAAWIGTQLEKELDLVIPEAEIGYITLHILGAKLFEPVDIGNNTSSLIKNLEPEILKVTKEIILLIENILSVDLKDDENLLVGLGLHLRTTVNRLKYGLSMRNPLLEKIKENYPSVFGASWATSILFEKYFNVKITEEEIGYIAIHVGAALERLHTKTRAIVVCATGLGTSQLVVSRLKNRIKNLEIVGITSCQDVKKYDSTEFDIIISTIPMTHDSKPVVKINVFVNDQDISAIHKYVKDMDSNKNHEKVSIEEVLDNKLFHKNFIFTHCNYKSKEELIKKLGNSLFTKGFVKKDFIASALSRENLTSTAVGKKVAIPHGQESYVTTPIIAIAILTDPIDWSGNQVDIVFLLALKFENGHDTRKFFKKFYSLLDCEDKLQEIRMTSNPDDVYELLCDI